MLVIKTPANIKIKILCLRGYFTSFKELLVKVETFQLLTNELQGKFIKRNFRQ